MTSDDPDENTVALNHAPRAIDGPCREFRQFRVFPAGRDAFVIGNPIGFPGRTFCEIIWANWCLAVAALPMLVQSGKFGFEILSFLKSSAQAILGRREPQHRHVGKMEQRRGGRRSGRYRIRTRQPVGNPAWWDPSALSRLWILHVNSAEAPTLRMSKYQCIRVLVAEPNRCILGQYDNALAGVYI